MSSAKSDCILVSVQQLTDSGGLSWSFTPLNQVMGIPHKSSVSVSRRGPVRPSSHLSAAPGRPRPHQRC